MLTESKIGYLQIQELLYVVYGEEEAGALIQPHSIMVVTSFPFGEIINSRDATSLISNWAMELMQYGMVRSNPKPWSTSS